MPGPPLPVMAEGQPFHHTQALEEPRHQERKLLVGWTLGHERTLCSLGEFSTSWEIASLLKVFN